MEKLNLTLNESKTLLTLMKNGHSTFSKQRYFSLFSMPKSILEKIANIDVEVENSSYTVYENHAFIRFEALGHEFELSLGECDIKYSDYKYSDDLDAYVDDDGNEIDSDMYAEQFAKDLWSMLEIEHLTAYYEAA